MKKLESTFTNMLLVLMGSALFAGLSLTLVYSSTKAPIEASKLEKQQNAIKEVLPTYERLADEESFPLEGVGDLQVYKAYDAQDKFVGAAVESFSKNGFGGEVRVMVGFDVEGNIVDYAVLEQKETPGLGTEMLSWFKPQGEVSKSLVEKIFGFEIKQEERKSSILGKNPGKNKLTVSKDGGEIDAITASTISSRAFLETVAYAYKAYLAIEKEDEKGDETEKASF